MQSLPLRLWDLAVDLGKSAKADVDDALFVRKPPILTVRLSLPHRLPIWDTSASLFERQLMRGISIRNSSQLIFYVQIQ